MVAAQFSRTSSVFNEEVQMGIRKYILSRAEAVFSQIDKLSYVNKLRLIDVLVFNKSEKVLDMPIPEWFTDGQGAWNNLLNNHETILLEKVNDWLLSVEESPSELEKFKLEIKELLNKANFSLSRLLKTNKDSELFSLQKQLWTRKTALAALFELPSEEE